MGIIKNLKHFIFFYEELAYLIALGYIVLIGIIIALSIIILKQNDKIEFQKGIIDNPAIYTGFQSKNKILESEYQMLRTRLGHR